MVELQSLTLNNVVHFRTATVPITDNDGLVVITGWNRDSKLAEDQNNGAGKSLLFSTLPNLLYEAPPLARTKVAKKDLLDKGSIVEALFTTSAGNTCSVEQSASKYIIEDMDKKGNFKDRAVRTKSDQIKAIQEIWPLSQAEFYSYVYTSSLRPSSFQMGSATQRLAFLTDVFRLDHYDQLKRHFSKLLSTVKDKQTRFELLEGKRLKLTDRIGEVAYGRKDKKRAETIKEELSAIVAELEEVAELRRASERSLSSIGSYFEAVAKLDSLVTQLPTAPDRHLVYLDKQSQRLADWSEYEARLETYKANTKDIQKELKKLTVEGSVKKIEKEYSQLAEYRDELVSHIDMLETKIRCRDADQSDLESYVKTLAKLGFKRVKDVDFDTDLEEEIGMARTTLKMGSLLDHSHDDNCCPTCQQEIDLKKIKKVVKKAEKRLVELKAIRTARGEAEAIEQMEQKLKGYPTGMEPELKDSKKHYVGTKERMLELKAYRKDLLRKADLEEMLAKIKEPVQPKKQPDEGITRDQIKTERKLCGKLTKAMDKVATLQEAYPDLKELKADDLDKQVSKSRKRAKKSSAAYDDLSRRVGKLQKEASSIDVRKAEHRLLKSQLAEYKDEIKEIKPFVAKRQMYTDLVEAYSAKGLKLEAVANVSQTLQNNLNKYANHLFAEPFHFEVDVRKDGVHVTVTNGGKPRDVSLLCGCETDCFRLLFMLCMLVMAPTELRTNFVVLDEPDSHMDDAARDHFINEFIPKLREVVPHIFVITPKSGEAYQAVGAEQWTVLRENGISELHIQKPGE